MLAINHAMKLMASGFAAAIGFICLAKGLFVGIDSETANSFFSILALQLFAVTAGVLGIDRRIISILSGRAGVRRLVFLKSFYFWIVLVAFALFIMLVDVYGTSWQVAIFVGLAVIGDVFGTIKQAQLSAELKTNEVLALNLIRYPVFFLFLAISGYLYNVNLEFMFFLFLVSSALRWIAIIVRKRAASDSLIIRPDFYLGGYQLSNYAVNRAAQIFIGIPFFSIDSHIQADFFLVWKIIEFLDKVIVVLFPVLYNLALKLKTATAWIWSISISCVAVLAFLAAYYFVSNKHIPTMLLICFAVHVLLIYPSNLLFSYSYRESSSGKIFVSGVFGVMLSLIVFFTAFYLKTPELAFVLFTPIGLLGFIIYCSWLLVNSRK